ncbi:MAG: hypothetical protein ACRDZ9_06170 [Acidimicrobiales bacterium]
MFTLIVFLVMIGVSAAVVIWTAVKPGQPATTAPDRHRDGQPDVTAATEGAIPPRHAPPAAEAPPRPEAPPEPEPAPDPLPRVPPTAEAPPRPAPALGTLTRQRVVTLEPAAPRASERRRSAALLVILVVVGGTVLAGAVGTALALLALTLRAAVTG